MSALYDPDDGRFLRPPDPDPLRRFRWEAIIYAYPYMMLYLIGTLPSMIAVGMNPFINAQGYSSIGMLSVAIGAGTNLVLDPLFLFCPRTRRLAALLSPP